MNVNKSTSKNKRKIDNEEFLWSDDRILLLLEVTLGYKSRWEFRDTSFTYMVKIRTKIEVS